MALAQPTPLAPERLYPTREQSSPRSRAWHCWAMASRSGIVWIAQWLEGWPGDTDLRALGHRGSSRGARVEDG